MKARVVYVAAMLAVGACNQPTRTTDTNSQAAATGEPAPAAPDTQYAAPSSSPPIELTELEKRRCDLGDCPAGSTVITGAKSSGPYFACQTEELSDYTNFVLGLLAIQKMFVGHMPNVNPETGEPEQEGTSAQILVALRSKAGIQTFDEAVARCITGPHRHRLTIMNYKHGRQSTWVAELKNNTSYWLPTSEIEMAAK